MPVRQVESQEELEAKFTKLEAWLTANRANLTPHTIASTELEIARLKNLHGGEGVNPQSDIMFPESTIYSDTPVNTPNFKNVPKQIISDGKDITMSVNE